MRLHFRITGEGTGLELDHVEAAGRGVDVGNRIHAKARTDDKPFFPEIVRMLVVADSAHDQIIGFTTEQRVVASATTRSRPGSRIPDSVSIDATVAY